MVSYSTWISERLILLRLRSNVSVRLLTFVTCNPAPADCCEAKTIRLIAQSYVRRRAVIRRFEVQSLDRPAPKAAPEVFSLLGSEAPTYHIRIHSMRCISPQKRRSDSNMDLSIFDGTNILRRGALREVKWIPQSKKIMRLICEIILPKSERFSLGYALASR
jgi:hypothetical protein